MRENNLNLIIPWPPTINTYWRRNGARYFISQKGISFRRHVISACSQHENYFDKEERLKIVIKAYPPDRRKRDLDNIFKSLLDSLQHAKIFQEDSQIDEIYIKRMPFLSNYLDITIESLALE